MKVYKNLAGNVGVCAYEFRNEEIKIKFHTRKIAVFNPKAIGQDHVEQMKSLARQGFGLNQYINENVKEQFDSLLD